MNVKQFFNAYEGLWVEYRGISNNETRDQCVDLFLVYNREVVGAPDMFGNAVDYWNNYPKDHYDRIENTSTFVPQLGDVGIWGTKYGPYGHIAIITDVADVKGFTSFDQNDPLKSSCHYQPHTYAGFLGVLRPKSLPQDIPVDPMKVKVDLGDPWGTLEVQAIKSKLKDMGTDLENERKKFDGFVEKWMQEWLLKHDDTKSDFLVLEAEMSQHFELIKTTDDFLEAISKQVDPEGKLKTQDALLEALGAVGTELRRRQVQIEQLTNKIEEAKVPAGYEFLKSWKMFNLMWKLYREKKEVK